MNKKLQSFISTRDRKLAKRTPWSPTPMLEAFSELRQKGCVTMGGRSTCGSYLDPTWEAFCAWNEIVRKAKSLGYSISEEEVKHGNGWATKAGGFWIERIYRLEPENCLMYCDEGLLMAWDEWKQP